MSEQNLSSIIDSFEELYRSNRRHGLCLHSVCSYTFDRRVDMTSSITSLVIEGISSHSILLDSYVVLHAGLISSLYKIVGVEFGMNAHCLFCLNSSITRLAAYFVQNVVMDYERHRKEMQTSEPQEVEVKGKECSNLMVLLSELYNFQVISSVLVFDLVRQLLEDDMTEFNIELLLKLMRSMLVHSMVSDHILMSMLDSGQQLRQDDPSALKDIIDIVQKKVSGRDERSLRCVRPQEPLCLGC